MLERARAYTVYTALQVNIGETTSLKPLPGVPSIGDAFPPWLVTAYRRGDLSSRLMDVLVSKTFW